MSAVPALGTQDSVMTFESLSIVIPAYNEASRLPGTLAALSDYLAASSLRAEVLVVDNGSTDGTAAVVEAAAWPNDSLRLLRLERRGKGLAVRHGVLQASGDAIFFADADRSWPVEAVGHFLGLLGDATQVVVGSREGPGASRVGEPYYRHLMGRCFNLAVKALAVPGLEDTQCGFKSFTRAAAHAIFRRATVDGFGFDVEVLYLARRLGYSVLEVPITWEHQASSRVEPLSDSLRMLRDVLRVRWNGLNHRYALTPEAKERLA